MIDHICWDKSQGVINLPSTTLSNVLPTTSPSKRSQMNSGSLIQAFREDIPISFPMSIKDQWVKEKMEGTQAAGANSATGNKEPASNSMFAKKWAKQKWSERWEHYLDTVPALRKTPAHEPKLSTRKKLHQGLRKAESSVAVQLRTEKVGFAAFLHERKVPGVLSPACGCGWRRQDPKHIIIFCPNHAATRNRLYEEAGTRHYKEILATKRGLRAVAGWIMREGLLHQFR